MIYNLEKENIKTIRQFVEILIKLYAHDIKYDLFEEVIQFTGIICNFYVEHKSSLLNISKSLVNIQ